MGFPKARIEEVIELIPAPQYMPDVYTNKTALWCPPGARGIYGGIGVAQCLFAAYRTIPEDWIVRSLHCYFILPGTSEDPIFYSVERVRDTTKCAIRTVRARQCGRLIFITTLTFDRKKVARARQTKSQTLMPDIPMINGTRLSGWEAIRPFQLRKAGVLNEASKHPHDKRIRHWIRASDHISESAGCKAHLCVLVYMSDSYFIGTVSRVHRIPRYTSTDALKRAEKWSKSSTDPEDARKGEYLRHLAEQEAVEFRASEGTDKSFTSTSRSAANQDGEDEISMMVSLTHSVYFHNPRAFRADEWILSEMESPWSGEGRGLVMQRMWSATGVLISSCVQEGVIRLRNDDATQHRLGDAKI